MYDDYNDELGDIRDYLAHFKWQLTSSEQTGISWLELLIGFEMLGFQFNPKNVDRRIRGRPIPLTSLRNTLDIFQK